MKGTNVFATKEQLLKLKTPGISLTLSPYSPCVNMNKTVHKCAIDSKLPDYSGYYGINIETGEFLLPDYEPEGVKQNPQLAKFYKDELVEETTDESS